MPMPFPGRAATTMMFSRAIRVSGRVQGVGFRPFLYRLALATGVSGWVRNEGGVVTGVIQGSQASLDTFLQRLMHDSPPLALPVLEQAEAIELPRLQGFTIQQSQSDQESSGHLPPDNFLCSDCLAEMHDPDDRRYRYPFINCTQCGPRYTLISALPYDRVNTSMSTFPLCMACGAEYREVSDRRFHAEPIACPACGPQLYWHQGGVHRKGNEEALRSAVEALRAGMIVAVKGIGGYHLMCDASNEAAVTRLRSRKRRPDKPLAVMFPWRGADGLDAVRAEIELGPVEAEVLRAPQRSIVLASRRPDGGLARSIAPGLSEIGAMLPYSPLHHLLLDDFGAALVATSGNVSGEPVLIDEAMAEQRLSPVADGFLHHDRPILRPADDSVLRVQAGVARPLRLGRGVAPLELTLTDPVPYPVLALGGEMKNAIALAWERRLVISPHIGELTSPRSMAVFEQVVEDLQRMYAVKAQCLICDAHPGYTSRRWASQSDLPYQTVYHHHAHASALYGEQNGSGRWLVFTWDGTGYGEDGMLWGGEALLGQPGAWRRVATLRPFSLPGGDSVARQPWRTASSLCWESGQEWPDAPPEARMLRQAWQRGINSPRSSAAGRLFDGASALLGLCQQASFEGQGPMTMEAIATVAGPLVPLPTQKVGPLFQIDWRPLLPLLLDSAITPAVRAATFHASLAAALVDCALRVKSEWDFVALGLSGGVFQNRLLTESILDSANRAGLHVRLHEVVPCNDGGLAYGQIIEAGGTAWVAKEP